MLMVGSLETSNLPSLMAVHGSSWQFCLFWGLFWYGFWWGDLKWTQMESQKSLQFVFCTFDN